MKSKIKIISVVVCGIVILSCCIFYKWYVSQAIYDIRTSYAEAESCSVRVMDAPPEGYFVYYYDGDDLAEMKVLEVAWQLSNITNERKDADNFWTSYRDTDGRYLDVMEKYTEDSIVPGYENKRIIPPGERADFIEYVLVPKESHEIRVRPGCKASQTGGDGESFVITF